jgi:hypothetical protein
MPSDQRPPQLEPPPGRWGDSRAAILWRLDRRGHAELAAKVRSGELSAQRARVLAGESPRRPRLRRGEIAITETEFARMRRRLQIMEDGLPKRVPRPAPQKDRQRSNSSTPKFDARALIG